MRSMKTTWWTQRMQWLGECPTHSQPPLALTHSLSHPPLKPTLPPNQSLIPPYAAPLYPNTSHHSPNRLLGGAMPSGTRGSAAKGCGKAYVEQPGYGTG